MTNNSKKTRASRQEEAADLTEGLEDTFPASDPLSMTQPHGGHPHQGHGSPSSSGTEAELIRQHARRAKNDPYPGTLFKAQP